MEKTQPAFVAMPFPQAQPHHYHGNEVPARVMVACDVLRDLTFKTMTKCWANDMGFNELPGEELLPVEREMQANACKMLSAYFRGELAPSNWEAFMINRCLPPQHLQP